MKALSIREPWATLIAQGKKTIETRVWETKHRGPILLCASKSPKSPLAGKAFAIVDIVDCRPMTRKDIKAAQCDVYPGAFSWVLNNIQLIKPFEVKGKLKFFEVPDELIHPERGV